MQFFTQNANLFKKCNIEYRDLSGVAVSMGPGSFTGLRVGVSYAKGICFALKIPLFGIDSLEALAHSAGFSERTIVPMIHARSDEIYIAAFKFIDGKLVRLLDNTLINFRDCGKFIKDKAVIIGSGSKKHLEALKNIFSDNFLEDRESLLPPVVSIAKYGNSAFMANKSVNLLNFEPKYLQIFPRSS